MLKKTKATILLVTILSISIITILPDNKETKEIQPDYKGLHSLGLIPNCNVPETKADKLIAFSTNKVLVESPFGCVYERSR